MSEIEQRLANLERLGYDIIKMGQAILAEVAQLSGRQIQVPAPEPAPVPEPVEEKPRTPSDTVGRFGKITDIMVLARAQELTGKHGDWSRAQLAAATGLKPSQLQPFLKPLIEDGAIEHHAGAFTCLIPPTMRDWAVRQEDAFTIEQAAEATEMDAETAEAELNNLAIRGILEWREDGRLKYVPPTGGPTSRPRHMPPERGRPSYELAMATGEAVRVAATKKATRRQRSVSGAGGVKGAKARDRRYNEMQAKKTERAEQRKAKAQQSPGFKSRSGKRSRPVT